MQHFTKEEIIILQREGMITYIGKKIPSPRSRTGYISREHVANVITGKEKAQSSTNIEILTRAKDFIRIYKQLNLKS